MYSYTRGLAQPSTVPCSSIKYFIHMHQNYLSDQLCESQLAPSCTVRFKDGTLKDICLPAVPISRAAVNLNELITLNNFIAAMAQGLLNFRSLRAKIDLVLAQGPGSLKHRISGQGILGKAQGICAYN